MSILNDFESTSGGAIWEPKQKGKGDTKKDLQPGDDSYFIGWYLTTKDDVGDNNSKIHYFKMMQVGNEEHIIGEIPDTGKVGIWGTGVLDSRIVEESIQVGQCVAIEWKGKQKPKSGSGKPYHVWDLMVPKDTSKYPPLSMNEIPSMPEGPKEESNPQEPQKSVPAPASSMLDDDGDDDLQF